MKTIAILAFVSLSFLSGLCQAQGLISAQIDSLVYTSMEMMPQVGIAVSVIEDGKIVHSKGYGLLSVHSQDSVDEHTLFQIASNTKAFTSAGLAILVDQGKIDWDDRVTKHIPEFTMYNDYVRENFTIVDLLTHRSGLGLGAGDLMIVPPNSDFTIDDILNNLQFLKPTSDFRTNYDYDNLLYLVAGEVIERASGQSYDDFITAAILNPLGMSRTALRYDGLKDKKNIASPHSTENGVVRKIPRYKIGDGPLAAAGGIYSSVDDMSKWLLVHLNQGKYGENLENLIFSPKRQSEMWWPHMVTDFEVRSEGSYKYHFQAYGLGWGIYDINGYLFYNHSGGVPGMLSRVLIAPELNSAVVVLTNGWPGGDSYYTICNAIRDEWLELEKWDYLASAKKQIEYSESRNDSALVAVWEIATNSDVEQLNAQTFLGKYEDDWFGEVIVENSDGNLWFRSLRSPLLNGEMFHFKNDTFAIKMSYTDLPCDAFGIFSMDESGKVQGMKMVGISPNIDFSFDYQDLDFIRKVE